MSINNIPQPRELFFIDTRLSTDGRYNVAEGPDSQEAASAETWIVVWCRGDGMHV
jgi:hypothetical protein